MGSFIRQASFSVGEVGPAWYGRDNIDQYQQGLRKLRNFIVDKSGSLLNRAGTARVDFTYGGAAGVVRTFAFSDDQNYVMSLGAKMLRLFTPQGTALSIAGGSTVMVVAGGVVLRSFDYGQTFRACATLPLGVTATAAATGDGNTWVVVGYDSTGGVAFTTADFGETWAQRAFPSALRPHCIAWSADGQMFIAAGESGGFAHCMDVNGVAWSGAAFQNLGITWTGIGFAATGTYRIMVTGSAGTLPYSMWGDYNPAWSGAPHFRAPEPIAYAGSPLAVSAPVFTGQVWVVGIHSFTTTWMLAYSEALPAWTAKYQLRLSRDDAGVGTTAYIALTWDGTTGSLVTNLPGGLSPCTAVDFPATPDTTNIVRVTAPTSISVAWAQAGGSRCLDDLGRLYVHSSAGWTLTSNAGMPNGQTPTAAAGSSGTATTHISIPYETADLLRLHFVQTGDVLYILHPDYAPRKLIRAGGTAGTPVFYITEVKREVLAAPSAPTLTGAFAAADDLHPSKSWSWVVSSVDQNYVESLPSVAYTSGSAVVYADRPCKIQWPRVTGARGYMVYRGRNGEYGWVGYVTASGQDTEYFNDDGQLPILSEPPTTSEDVLSQKWPATAAFYQDRLATGGTSVEPNTLRLSATGQYLNFSLPRVYKSTSPMMLAAASRQFEEIRALVPMRELLVLTSESEASLSAANAGALTAQNFDYKVHGQRGCAAYPAPLVVGSACLFVQKQGNGIRDLVYDSGSDSYDTSDLLLFAEHLLAGSGRTVVDWCYCQQPYSIIWCALSDGKVASLSYVRELKQFAWAEHDLGGVTTSCCAVNNGVEDLPWFVVNFTGVGNVGYAIVRMLGRAEGCFLDSAVKFLPGWSSLTVADIVYPVGGEGLWAYYDGRLVGPLVPSAGVVTLPSAPTQAGWVGLLPTCQLEPLDVAGARARRKLVLRTIIEFGDLTSLEGTFGNIIEAGEREADLVARPVSDILDNQLEINVDSSYNPGGRCVVRYRGGASIEIVGITREVQEGV